MRGLCVYAGQFVMDKSIAFQEKIAAALEQTSVEMMVSRMMAKRDSLLALIQPELVEEGDTTENGEDETEDEDEDEMMKTPTRQIPRDRIAICVPKLDAPLFESSKKIAEFSKYAKAEGTAEVRRGIALLYIGYEARKRFRTGRGTLQDRRLLAQHHGSMPPSTKKEGKAAGKTKSDDRAPTTKLEFGYPPDLTNALKAISDRATQDLWQGSAGIGGGEPTAEQLAQRHANMIHRLSKRIAGDVRAKEALKTALTQWTASLGHHLAALVPRVQAISQKLDDDLSEACQEMQTAAVISATSQEKILHAQAQLGPTWSSLQEQEIYRIAGALRAFGAVQPSGQPISSASGLGGGFTVSTAPFPGRGADANQALILGPMSPMSSSSTLTLGMATPAMGSGMAATTTSLPEGRVSRWQKRPSKSGSDRPGKSPRRDLQPPWSQVATGRTPEGIPRTAATEIEADVELIPDHTQPLESPSWFTAWLQVTSFAVSQGSELIGELASNAEQDSMLPLHPDSQLEDATVVQAQALWLELGQMVATPNEGLMAGLYAKLRDFLQMVRLCPNALPRLQQGLVLAMQVTLGNILDPYSYAPSTAQEWLYPSILLEHGGPFVGYIPPLVSAQIPVQVLATLPCPYVPVEPSMPDNNEL
ncbi:hypothetical protein AK812_SmicGene23920 [Symbiodinium microadriaticum]|uniref:Uncharacterized protein n=1 Tax=Symbiodinium microadriaticum TaxID=2951 RepID=A0A1Q9DFZ5_SYMMI|nr:hypothetical protein AK812_SmicGene23920 [Symbiodinium microadriaticum]